MSHKVSDPVEPIVICDELIHEAIQVRAFFGRRLQGNGADGDGREGRALAVRRRQREIRTGRGGQMERWVQRDAYSTYTHRGGQEWLTVGRPDTTVGRWSGVVAGAG
eukprot:COSAG02_NODE_1967_length_10229_cov_11.346002_6_plen_107_part_00